jgi:serine/threonine protein kinase
MWYGGGAPRAANEDVALIAFDSVCRRAEEGRFPRLDDRDGLWQVRGIRGGWKHGWYSEGSPGWIGRGQVRGEVTSTGRVAVDESQFRRIDEVCDDFEAAWRAGERPCLEDYLGRAPACDQAELRGELKRLEMHYLKAPALPDWAKPGGSELQLEMQHLAAAGRAPHLASRGTPGHACVAGYEILEELDRGGMGVVYKARQVSLNRIVALKMILAGGHAGEAERARFRTEAEAIARLQHPNVVQVFEVGEHNGLPFISMEFCPGGSLERKLAGKPLPVEEAVAMVRTLAGAMHAAHEAKVIHRDLKPANVLLSADGTPKITDFGLAKKLDEKGHTQTGAVMGTPSYMAPEQAEGKKQTGPAADIYALGAILYRLLTGHPPFRGASLIETLDQVRFQAPVPPRRLQPELPVDVERICLKCLNKQPEQRFPTAMALAKNLEQILSHRPLAVEPSADSQVGVALDDQGDPGEPRTIDHQPVDAELDGCNLPIGREVVPGYRLVELLLSYDLSHTYKAEGPGGFPVAIQWKPRSGGDHQRLLDRSLDLFRSIRHPHLLPIFGVWRTSTADVIAMELADSTLEDRLRKVREDDQSGIPLPELLQYVEDAAKGIDYLNQPRHTVLDKTGVSVVHGDVKPRHLRLVGGRVKVAEFIFAQCLDPARPDLDTPKSLRGTTAYMAPERARGETSIQTDQYSLAATYYRLRTGRVLFTTQGITEFLQRIQECNPDLIDLPEKERRVLLRALARRPKDRWPSCQAFVAALAESCAGKSKRKA